MPNLLIVRTLVYTFFQTYKNIPKQLILIDFRILTTNLKIGKRAVRGYVFYPQHVISTEDNLSH